MGRDTEKSQRPPAWAAAVVVVLVLVLLYVLSSGPVIALCGKYGGGKVRAVVFTFYIPLAWVAVNTPLEEPLSAYLQWWCELLGVGP